MPDLTSACSTGKDSKGIKTNRYIIETEENMKMLASYIVDNAPAEILRTFSTNFLASSFKNDPDCFFAAWDQYMDMTSRNNGKIIQFPDARTK